MDYFEWDGTHVEDTDLGDWVLDFDKSTKTTLDVFCNCVGYFDNKGCCSMVVNGEKVRIGDRLYKEGNELRLVRGDTEPFICPVHKEEHKGTGTLLCIYTGQNL